LPVNAKLQSRRGMDAAGRELEEMAGCPGEEFTPPAPTEDLEQVQGKVTSAKFTAIKPSTAQPRLGSPQGIEKASKTAPNPGIRRR